VSLNKNISLVRLAALQQLKHYGVTTDTLQQQLCASISPTAILGKHYVQSDQLLFLCRHITTA